MAIDRVQRRVATHESIAVARQASPFVSVVRRVAAVALALLAILVVLPAALAASAT